MTEDFLDRLLNSRPALLEGINSTIVKMWLSKCKLISANKGEILLRNDEESHYAYLVMSGGLEVKLHKDDDTSLAKIGPGEIVGEVSALTEGMVSAWVICAEPSKILKIQRFQLLDWAQESHQLALNLLRLLCLRLGQSNLHARSTRLLNNQLQTKALTDSLTGLLNRHWLRGQQDSLESQERVGVLAIDIDHFKSINDQYGHGGGDLALQAISLELRSSIRPEDAAVRLGGEEFLIICTDDVSEMSMLRLADRLRQRIEANSLIPDKSQRYVCPMTVSIGLALRLQHECLDDLLTRADIALYRAKNNGRNRVELG